MVKVGDYVYLSKEFNFRKEIGWWRPAAEVCSAPYEVIHVRGFDGEVDPDDEIYSVRLLFKSKDGESLRWYLPYHLIIPGERPFTKNINPIKKDKRSW